MNQLIQMATADVAGFLAAKLPELAPDWWQRHVLDRLSFQQQRVAEERRFTSLQQFDFAALLRVLDQNWHDLGGQISQVREARSWVKELQTVRNKWAHLSAEALPSSEIYRDADTLSRVLSVIGAPAESLAAVETVKGNALVTMAGLASYQAADNAGLQSTAPSTPPLTEATAPPATAKPLPTVGHLFKVGDLVSLRSDTATLFPVIEIIAGGAECRYRVFQNNSRITYYESQLLAAQVVVDERQSLSVNELHAHLTSLKILSPSTANLFSLRSGRVQFVPYQYRPVLKLIRSDRPRLLIADEVGVGKTIEAGLIIKELRARMDISSVLVICSKTLVAERKWFNEMKRFDEHFTALDGPLLRHCLQETHLDGEWPEQYAKVLLPFSLFDSDLIFGRGGNKKKKDHGLLGLDPPPKFDLVIIDEAHHIRNSETMLHQGVRYFCDNAQAVVMLTATPVQLGSYDLFTLLNVLRPDLIIDPPSFAQMAEPNRHINAAVRHCRLTQPGWQREACACLDQVAQTEWGRLFLREALAFQAAYDLLQGEALSDTERVGVIRAIEELYTFSHLINRTRRRDIGEFTTRKPETVSIAFTPEQQQLHDGLLGVIAKILTICHDLRNVNFLMTTIRRQAASCLYGLAPLLADILGGKLSDLQALALGDNDEELDFGFIGEIKTEISRLLDQARVLDPHDPKAAGFVQVLRDKSAMVKNKVLVFSTFRHTLAYLEKQAGSTGLRVGLVHGDVAHEERADLRRRFALPKEDGEAIDVLLSSEVGCEGLDFQFCDMLINYDLPWNPMRIEQRIGRIDRYGQQSETVAIVNFITPGTVDADIYDRCLMRIGVFQHAVGGSEEILGSITQQLRDVAESFSLSAEERAERLRQLADNDIRLVREEQELEEKQAELFGLNIPGRSWREDIEAAESFWLSPAAMQTAVTTYLEARLGSGIEHLLGEKPLKTLRLGQEARNLLLEEYKRLPRSVEPVYREWEKWLKGSHFTLPVTFDQETAAENPQAVHLSLFHPLLRQAAHFLEIAEPKYFSMEAQQADFPPGEHHFAVYRWTKHGVKVDELLVAVADNPQLEAAIFDLLQKAEFTGLSSLPTSAECDALDGRHHSKWNEAQANHIAENRQLVEFRIQSLTVSHRARCKAVEDQLARATNDKIRLMKEGELTRAKADFDRRMAELQQAANGGDIRATPVLFGTIMVVEG